MYTKRIALEPTQPRKSLRNQKPSVLLNDFVTNIENDLQFSQTCKDQRWIEAMESEMASIRKMKTWQLVELPPGHCAMTARWIFKIKPGINGQGERYKAHVARGYQQKTRHRL